MRLQKSSAVDEDDFLGGLYDQYSDYLYKLAWDLSSSAQDIDDLVQTVWEKLITREQTLRTLSHPQKLNYIEKTLKNTLREDARKRKLAVCSLDYAEGYDLGHIDEVNDAIDQEIQSQLFSKAWAMVKGDIRELLERKYDIGESDEEISRAMGSKTASVRMYLSRARKAARDAMRDYKNRFLR